MSNENKFLIHLGFCYGKFAVHFCLGHMLETCVLNDKRQCQCCTDYNVNYCLYNIYYSYVRG